MHSVKFTTIVSLLLLGVIAEGSKPSPPTPQLPISANTDIKPKSSAMPISMLHASSKDPKAMKAMANAIKSKILKDRSTNEEENFESNASDAKPLTHAKSENDDIEGFAISNLPSEKELLDKINSKAQKLPKLAKLLNTNTIPNEDAIEEVREEIAKHLKDDRSALMKDMVALTTLYKEEKIIDLIKKIELIPSLEFADIFPPNTWMFPPNGMGSGNPFASPFFPFPLMGAPMPGGPNMDPFKPNMGQMPNMGGNKPGGNKIKASSVNQPQMNQQAEMEQAEEEEEMEQEEQEEESFSESRADPKPEEAPLPMTPLPLSLGAPAPNSSPAPAPPSSAPLAPSSNAPGAPLPAPPASPSPQAAPPSAAPPAPAPLASPAPQSQQSEPSPQSTPSAPSASMSATAPDAKAESMTTEGLDIE